MAGYIPLGRHFAIIDRAFKQHLNKKADRGSQLCSCGFLVS